MTDRYIDYEETQIYGPYAAAKIRSMVVGLLTPFDTGLKHIADDIEHATETVQSMLSSSDEADAALRHNVYHKEPALTQVFELFSRFSSHLDAHPKGTVDRKTFFKTDGTIRGIGRSAPRVLQVLTHISTMLKDKNCTVKDAKVWQKELEGALKTLTPILSNADGAKAKRRATTPELEAAREAWLQTYIAAKSIVEGVLRMQGKLHLMPVIFYDLAVPSHAKVTQPPTEEHSAMPTA